MKKLLLEIGPGDTPLGTAVDGCKWKTLDARAFHGKPLPLHTDHVCRWGEDRLPFADGAVHAIYASHVIEHIEWSRVAFALEEACRVLRPGGTLEVWTVDFAVLIRAWLDRKALDAWDARGLNPSVNPALWVQSRLFAADFDGTGGYLHRSCFDAIHLTDRLLRAGFTHTKLLTKRDKGHDHGVIDLGILAMKELR